MRTSKTNQRTRSERKHMNSSIPTIEETETQNPNLTNHFNQCSFFHWTNEHLLLLSVNSNPICQTMIELLSPSEPRKQVLISAVNCQKTEENYLIELDKQRADLIVKEFNNDLGSIVQNLQILNRRLVLLNPKIGKKMPRRRIL